MKTLSADQESQLNSFDPGCFSGFSSLYYVDLTNCKQLKILPNDIFLNCYKLSTVVLPKDGILETISGGSFGQTSIQSITLPPSVKYLQSHAYKQGAFSYCSRLSKINFYSVNNIELVNQYVFYFTGITEFDIGPKLQTIYGSSFECTLRTFIKFTQNEPNPNFMVYNDMLYNANGEKLIRCPTGLINFKLHPNVKTLALEAFEYNPMKEALFLSNSTTTLSDYAFADCYSLKKIFLPDSIKTINSFCFTHCHKLEELIIPPKVTIINSQIISSCNSLMSLTIYDTIKFIYEDAFSGSPLIQTCGITCSLAMKNFLIESFHFNNATFNECHLITPTCFSLITYLRFRVLIFSAFVIYFE